VTPLTTARLACGCRIEFRGEPGRAVTVLLQRKADTCAMALHVAGMALYDHRSALRPATRVPPALQPDYEDG
jgi:hypothetical protein